MKNILIILSCVADAFIIFMTIMSEICKKKIDNLDLNNTDDFLFAAELCFGPIVEKYKNATVILFKEYHEADCIIAYDFSLWKEKQIICITDYGSNNEKNNNKMAVITNQLVCKFKDGTILWLPI